MAASEVSADQPVSGCANASCDEHAVNDAETTEAVACGSQNGMTAGQTDRFGFRGGHQYTDPSRYVDIILCLFYPFPIKNCKIF